MSELVKVDYKEYGIEESKATEMTSGLQTVLAEREELKKSYADVITLEITEENLLTFKELRLKIRDNRTKGIDAWHKVNKDFYLRGGQFIDAIKRKEILVNEQMEEKLQEAEKFFENQEKERIAELQKTRLSLISEYVEDTTGLDLGNMPDEVFEGFFNLKKTQKLERIEAERIAEEKRIEAEKAESLRIETERLEELEKQKAIQAENDRLKKEAEAKEKALFEERKIQAEKHAKEKKEQEAILQKERQEKEKIESELKAKQQAEEEEKSKKIAEILERQKEAEKLAKAPIKKQLSVWVESFEINTTYIDSENETANLIKDKFNAFKSWAKSEIDKI